jgi:hypothetical protein
MELVSLKDDRIARWFGRKLMWLGIGLGVGLVTLFCLRGIYDLLSLGPVGVIIFLLICILCRG